MAIFFKHLSHLMSVHRSGWSQIVWISVLVSSLTLVLIIQVIRVYSISSKSLLQIALKATSKKCILENFVPVKADLARAIKVLHSGERISVMRNNKGTRDFTYPLFVACLGEIADTCYPTIFSISVWTINSPRTFTLLCVPSLYLKQSGARILFLRAQLLRPNK